jgi:hypothetical protein
VKRWTDTRTPRYRHLSPAVRKYIRFLEERVDRLTGQLRASRSNEKRVRRRLVATRRRAAVQWKGGQL